MTTFIILASYLAITLLLIWGTYKANNAGGNGNVEMYQNLCDKYCTDAMVAERSLRKLTKSDKEFEKQLATSRAELKKMGFE